jgi:DNA-directed RNA polymerase sigma subunit (sigma70/sigma32)
MSAHEPIDELSEERRKEIFRAVVDAQDLHEFTPAQARQLIARRFAITEKQVRQIEEEGMDQLGPPL